MSTSLTIKSTADSKTKSKSVPYINPNASNSELLAFARGLINLTANQTYSESKRVDVTDLDSQALSQRTISRVTVWSGATSQSFTDGMDQNPIVLSYPRSKFGSATAIDFLVYSSSFNADSILPIFSSETITASKITWVHNNANSYWSFSLPIDGTITTHNFSILFPASDTFDAKTFNFQFIIDEEA